MSEYKRIGLQFFVSYSYQIFLVLLNLVFLSVTTRLLTKSDYGLLSLSFVFIVLLERFLTMGFPEYIVKEISGLKGEARSNRISNIFSFQLFVSFSFLILCFVFSILNITVLGSGHYRLLMLFTGLIVFVSTLIMILVFYIISKRKLITYTTVSFFIQSWMMVVLILGWIYSSLNVNGILIVRLIVYLLVLIAFILVFCLKKEIKLMLPQKKVIVPALAFSLPLLPVLISEYILTASDRLVLGIFHGASSVGSYAYFYSILSFIILFAIIPNENLFPYAARDFRKNREKSNFFLNAGAKYTFMLLIPFLVGLFILRKDVISLISGPKYIPDLYLMSFLIIFPLIECCSIFYRKAILLHGRTKQLFFIYLLGAALNVLLNFLLIPKLSVIGAALSTVISYSFLLILLFREGRTYIRWDNKFMKVHGILASTAVMAVLLLIFNPHTIITKAVIVLVASLAYLAMLFITKTIMKEEISIIKSLFNKLKIN